MARTRRPGRVPTKKSARGPINRVPCAHCKRTNDLRNMTAGPRNAGWGANLLESGNTFICDHCNRVCQIVKVQSVQIVTVRQHNR